MKTNLKTSLLLLLNIVVVFVNSKPTGGGGFQAEGSFASGGIPPLISFDKGGNVGVNFGGYHASAGLGGLLSGDWAKGGLHAEAGTPTGQAAAAGLGGGVVGRGAATGGLYAGATSGHYKSSAGLFGVAQGSEQGALHIDNQAHAKGVVVAEKTVSGHPEVQRTIIEKTVIPNYVEKKVQETHYVEKTIKVPQTVEKIVRVPVAPTVYEKTIEVPQEHIAQKNTGVFAAGALDVRAKPVVRVAENYVPASVGVVKYGSVGSGYNHGSAGEFYAGGGLSSGGGYGKGALFTDIFNIPISTLGAVRNLLTGIAGSGAHAGGSFTVNKHVNAY